MQTKEWIIFRHLTLKKSRGMFITEYITDVRSISQKQKVKQTQIKGKECISSRSRRKLVHGPYISTKFS